MKEVRAVLQRADEAVQQGFDCLTGTRLKIRLLIARHQPCVVGIVGVSRDSRRRRSVFIRRQRGAKLEEIEGEYTYNILTISNLEAEVGIAPRSPSPRQNLADFAP